MHKKNAQAVLSTQPNDGRRNSAPSTKDKPKKHDFLAYYKNGSAQISRTPAKEPKHTSEALTEREANHLYNELQKAHTNLPKPEAHPTLLDREENYHSHNTSHSKGIEDEEIEESRQNVAPIPAEERTSTTKPQSIGSKSVERSSKVFTESDEEKEDDREHEKKQLVEEPTDDKLEDISSNLERFSHNHVPSIQGGRTFNMDQAPLTGPDLNASHSSKSTVLLAESPRAAGKDHKSNENLLTEETQGSTDTKEPEIQEAIEVKTPRNITTDASKAIENVVAHDGPLLQPKPQEVSHANIVSMKNKINLEVYLKVENLLYVIKDNIMSAKPIFQFCRDYIEIAPKMDRENFEKILTTEQEKKLVKSSFIVKRLGIILMLYFTVENTPNEKAMFQLKSLINGIHQNFIIVGYLISTKLKDKSKSNVWTARLLELLEHDSSSNFTKSENLDKLAYNNNNLCNIMKNLIVSMRNKEILYAFNSIVVQLDRISIKEAYTRLLKSFSVFMSEKELKTQVGQYMPKKPVPESKVQQLLKMEKKKDELAFLPKLVKSGVEAQYTLVVDLDETLVHYAELPGKLNELRVRPYVAHFLTEVSKYYEIVVFTAAMQEYADWVLDNIDKEHCVTHRLYRQHASPDGYNFVKDLSKLGRDMAKIMIVDNLAENFRLQPDNGIYIKPWYDDPEDTALLELTPLLVEIARKKVPDVRVALRRFRDQMIENIEKGFDNPHMNLQLD